MSGLIDDEYLSLLLCRDSSLCYALKEILRDEILADVSDYGVDLAVGRMFTRYQPGTRRWEQLRYSNDGWLTCQTEATMSQPLLTVHINLIDGELRVGGQPLRNILLEYTEISCGVRTSTCWSF